MTRPFLLPSTLVPALLACLATCLLAAPAVAEDDLPITSRFFEEFDRNSDGVVTAQEFDGSQEVFRLLDEDGDGQIQAKELGLPSNFRPDARRKRDRAGGANAGGDKRRGKGADRLGRLKQAIEKMDANQDGKVTKAEWKRDANLFERLDRNGDGVIDAQDAGDGMMEGMDGPMAEGGPRATDGGGSGASGDKPNKGPRNAGRDAGPLNRVKQMDTDGDGTITRDEWRGREQGFARLDRDGDGVISAEELAPKAGGTRGPVSTEQAEERFRQLDSNGDGELTDADSMPERFTRIVLRMDADESGGVSLAEFQAAVEKGEKKRVDRRKGGSKRMLKRFDTDKDGRVSRDEFPLSDERFDAIDTNGDGYLTEADLADAPTDEAPKRDAPETPSGDAGK